MPPYDLNVSSAQPPKRPPTLPLDTALLKPGLRLAVGVSGGADSVALLRSLHHESKKRGLVLHIAHLHHGLRGAEADADLEFVRGLAAELGLRFHQAHVHVVDEAREHSETLEEAARRLRYAWFRQLMAEGHADAVATAHTLDDQAETVLAKFLRGAWTEGLSGIHPVVEFTEGRILRPLLATTRSQIEEFLNALGQHWREDSSNRQLAFTRNRIRHELLPLLEGWNPRLREHLSQMAELARAEESWWQGEMARLAAQVILPGRPVRGGGRSAAEGLAIDLTRLAGLSPATQRRLLRFAAAQLCAEPDFAATEELRALALHGRAGQRSEAAQGLHGERTHRELRLTVEPAAQPGEPSGLAAPVITVPVPGEVDLPEFGLRLRIHPIAASVADQGLPAPQTATFRNWRAGDRVFLRHSSGPRKVKEVLERMKVTGSARAFWPVIEAVGRIVWMKGVEVEPDREIAVTSLPLNEA